jgi:hypothetical protein
MVRRNNFFYSEDQEKSSTFGLVFEKCFLFCGLKNVFSV